MCLFYLIEDYHVSFLSCEFVCKFLCLAFGLGFPQGIGEQLIIFYVDVFC
jgi:hypothetical protein